MRLSGNKQRKFVVGKIAGNRGVGIDQIVVVLLVKLLDQRQAARSDLKGLTTLNVDLPDRDSADASRSGPRPRDASWEP